MTPLRVLHLVTAAAPIAGAERLLVDIAEYSSAEGKDRWEVAFATLSPRGELHEAIEVYGHQTFALGLLGIRFLPKATWGLRRLVANFRPDVLHAHLSHASIAGAIIARSGLKTRFIQTRHYSSYVAQFRSSRRIADAWAARQADRVIAVSNAARDQLVEHEHVPAERVHVVENGVNVERLSKLRPSDGRRALHELGVDPKTKIIGCAASFNVRKGHEYLLDAMKLVLERHPETSLVLLGTGELEGSVRARANGLGLSAHIHFLGHRPDAHQLLTGLDVYVQPSIEEGFGLAVVEAMATRRPVVATSVGGMLRTVVPEQTGLLVPPADPRALADSLIRLLDTPQFATSLGDQACERTRNFYSITRMLDAYDDIYRA